MVLQVSVTTVKLQIYLNKAVGLTMYNVT